jgi:hypothetical protein
MQKVLVFAGTKQSHKSTSAKYITGSRMKKAGLIKFFEIDNDGDLIVPTSVQGPDGELSEGRGVLDLRREDEDFARYAYENIWPLAKIYSFADGLKESAISIFSLNPKNIYGTDKDKEEPTTIVWKNVFDILPAAAQTSLNEKYKDVKNWKKQCMTHRELLQYFSDVCKVFDFDCWVKATWEKIKLEGFPYCIIDDCRFENEVDVSRANNADVILLTHQPFKDTHASEQIHKVDRAKFSYILDNADMTFEQKNEELEKILTKFGWNTGNLV